MPRYYLARLSVEGFRGIKNEGDPLTLRFKPNAVSSIYAQNGIGKTSLFEAISYAIFGKLPKLDGLQRSERPETYYVNRFHTGGVGSIALEFKPDDGTAAVAIVVQRTAAGQRPVHTNSAEGYNDRVRRTISGVFHHISPPHAKLYLNEISFRWSQRVVTTQARRRTRKGHETVRTLWSRIPPALQLMAVFRTAVGKQIRRTPDGSIHVKSAIAVFG